MSRRKPTNPEQGAGWEVLRGFLNPELAKNAGKQALLLINGGFQDYEWYKYYDKERPGQVGLLQHRINAWETARYPKHLDTICANEVLVELVPDLLLAHKKSSRYNDGTVRSLFINEYEVGGHSRKHRDRFQGGTVAVSILGTKRWQIVDPVTELTSYFDFEIGDAMHLINPRQQRLRPLHRVFNTSSDTMLSLVE